MNSDKFFQKIRSIIREEIEIALDSSIKNSKKELDIKPKKDVSETKLFKKPKEKISEFSSIQDILNETKRSLQESYDSEYDNMNLSGIYNTDSIHYNNVPSGMSGEEIPSNIMNALNRDYSKLMQKIDEKKGK
jgi:hypothetical protein